MQFPGELFYSKFGCVGTGWIFSINLTIIQIPQFSFLAVNLSDLFQKLSWNLILCLLLLLHKWFIWVLSNAFKLNSFDQVI